MNKRQAFLRSVVAAGVATFLVACGGGGGSSGTTSGAAATPTTLTGVAATGAAFAGAIITVTDKTGTVVGTSSAVGTDGTFSITLSANAVAPFVLTASRTNADGQTESLVSVVPSATSSSTVNISPVTQLIASRLSVSGDPSKLAAELAAGTSTINTTTVAAKVTEVQAILAPLLTATSNSTVDPLTGTFAADGTGYDRALDSLKVTITPSSATTTNIEVGLKQSLPEGTAPNVVSFTNQTSAPPALPTVVSNTLVPAGTAALIASELAQLTACYALPVGSRVNSTVTSGLAIGTAANVTATECKAAFLGNDPTQFKSNGANVGRDSNGNGAFASLFKDAATGVKFTQGTYEFSRANGDIVAGYKSRDLAGNETYDTFVLRLDTDGKLKLIGNQYAYAGGVVPYQQLREFSGQAASSYYSTGYDLRVPLINGISYVDVLTPKGTHVTLIPGSDSMVLPKRNVTPLTASGTTFLRIRSEYAAASGMPTSHPSALEANLFFASTELADTEVATIPNQGVWAFSYYSGGTNGAGGTQQGATQYYKTRTRASTIAELKTQVWANLSTASLAEVTSRMVTAGTTGAYSTLPATSNVSVTWDVPTGALPPTQIKLFGNALYYDYTNSTTKAGNAGFTSTTNAVTYASGRTPFNDGKSVGSTSRSGTFDCSDGAIDANNMGEKHCANPGYLTSARQNGLHLWARDPNGREYAHFYATYTLQ